MLVFEEVEVDYTLKKFDLDSLESKFYQLFHHLFKNISFLFQLLIDSLLEKSPTQI